MTAEPRRAPAGAAVLREGITSALQQAVIEELASVGYGRLSIEAVARRAGVGKTAVYRRWSSKSAMVLEIVAEVAAQRLPLPDTGTLRGDIEALTAILMLALRHPLFSTVVPDLLAEAARNPELAQTLQEALRANQQEIGRLLIGRAVQRGDLAADTDPVLAADLIIGPVYWHLAVTRTPHTPDFPQRIAAMVEAALRSTG
ncbi:AcrR family transcriptional regulator [Allocatelliglobosispora scoriae]|uniref:AcrR family transcriptional regulator n=1 Tax=Allocatelliglobosispora scoriae TaxID=643052 RepID=A0A841BI96_9ACTN|nr:TetR/AcrR family transcriptional regulator [Allocatelliglobosispora scoriae]MBB5866906.1 AcrR family transcriptional regulator [Allocatelliglobosispora scoriae]